MKLKSFDPVKEFGAGWSVESDNGIASRTNLKLKSYLEKGENWISGETVLKRNSGDTPLSASAAQYYKENPSEYPEDWKGKYVFFDGTILRSPGGGRSSLCSIWVGGAVGLDYSWLVSGRYAIHPSALLASAGELETKDSELGALHSVSREEALKLVAEMEEIIVEFKKKFI